jgi:hypothetical protein
MEASEMKSSGSMEVLNESRCARGFIQRFHSRHVKGLTCLVLALAAVLAACWSMRERVNEKAYFVDQFHLQTVSYEINMTELYNNYESFPYEGMALYQVTFTEDASDSFADWAPLDETADSFLESVSDYVALPTAANGTYKLIDRSGDCGDGEVVTNASLCVYDAAANTAYYLKLDT